MPMRSIQRSVIILLFGFLNLSGSVLAHQNSAVRTRISVENASQLTSIRRFGRGIVERVAWSSNNETLAICTTAGIWLMRAAVPDDKPALLQDKSDCHAIAFSPDGSSIASYGTIDDPTVRVWDTKTGALKLAAQWQGQQPGWIYAVAFSPDSSSVAFGGSTAVQLYNLNTKSVQIFSTSPYASMPNSLAVNGSSTILAVGGDYGVKIWDIKSTKVLAELREGRADQISFSPDEKFIVAASGKTIRFWNVTGGQRGVFDNKERVFDARFSVDGKTIISTTANSTIVWDVAKFVRVASTRYPYAPLRDVMLNRDGSLVAGISNSGDGVYIWETKTAKPRGMLPFTRQMRGVRFSVSGQNLIFGGNSGAWIWNLSSDNVLELKPKAYTSYSVVGFMNGDSIAYTSDESSGEQRWSVSSGQELPSVTKQPYGGRKALSADGRLLAIRRRDESIIVLNADTGEPVQSFIGHSDLIRYLLFSPDGKLLVSSANDSTIRLWDVGTGKEVLQIKEKSRMIVADFVAFNPNGSEIVSGIGDTLTFWSVDDGRPLRTLTQPSAYLYRRGIGSIAFSPDGSVLASTGSDGNLYLWDVRLNKLIKTVEGHLQFIQSINFNSEGTLIASASEDGTVRVWGVP